MVKKILFTTISSKDFSGISIPRKEKQEKQKLWTMEEDSVLFEIAKTRSNKKWKKAEEILKTKTAHQCYIRFKTINPIYKKGKWSKEEDELVNKLVMDYGENWRLISKILKSRSNKQIKLRYENYLKNGLNLEQYSPDEDRLLMQFREKFGNKWSLYKKYFPNRSALKIKRRVEKLLRVQGKNDISECDFKNNFNNQIRICKKFGSEKDPNLGYLGESICTKEEFLQNVYSNNINNNNNFKNYRDIIQNLNFNKCNNFDCYYQNKNEINKQPEFSEEIKSFEFKANEKGLNLGFDVNKQISSNQFLSASSQNNTIIIEDSEATEYSEVSDDDYFNTEGKNDKEKFCFTNNTNCFNKANADFQSTEKVSLLNNSTSLNSKSSSFISNKSCENYSTNFTCDKIISDRNSICSLNNYSNFLKNSTQNFSSISNLHFKFNSNHNWNFNFNFNNNCNNNNNNYSNSNNCSKLAENLIQIHNDSVNKFYYNYSDGCEIQTHNKQSDSDHFIFSFEFPNNFRSQNLSFFNNSVFNNDVNSTSKDSVCIEDNSVKISGLSI